MVELQIPMNMIGYRFDFRKVITAFGHSAAPSFGFLGDADCAMANQFDDTTVIFRRVDLGTHLGGQLAFVFQVGFPNHTGFVYGVRQRFFTIHVQSSVHRPDIDKGVGMIGRGTDHRVEIFLFQTLAPIDISLGLGKSFGGFIEIFLIHVT